MITNVFNIKRAIFALIIGLFCCNSAGYASSCTDGNPIVSLGSSADCGSSGPAVIISMGTPNTRSLSLATAYQATVPAKISIFTITITSTATF